MADQSFPERLKANLGRWGWLLTLQKLIFGRAARFLGIHIHLVRVRPMAGQPEYPQTPPEIRFKLVDPEDCLRFGGEPELDLDRDFVVAAIERGDLMFGAFDGDSLVSYVWRTATTAPHNDRLWVRVDPPYCYCYKSLTLPPYRGKRISPAAHLFSDVEMASRGFSHRAGFVSVANLSSISMGKYMGSIPIGYAGYISWFGQTWPFRTRSVRKIGFEFYKPA